MISTAARWVAVAALCRRFGVTVRFDKGWQTRGRGTLAVFVFVLHHTASSVASGINGALSLVRNGKSRGLDNALSNVHLNRRGVVRIIARGTAWHAGTGSWRGITGNSRAAGCEWENNGVGERATPAALHAYVVLAAAICHVFALSPALVCGHKEWTSRKIDPRAPNFPTMPRFRRQVEQVLHRIRNPEDEMTPKDHQQIAAAIDAAVKPLAARLEHLEEEVAGVPKLVFNRLQPKGGAPLGDESDLLRQDTRGVRRILVAIADKVGAKVDDADRKPVA